MISVKKACWANILDKELAKKKERKKRNSYSLESMSYSCLLILEVCTFTKMAAIMVMDNHFQLQIARLVLATLLSSGWAP